MISWVTTTRKRRKKKKKKKKKKMHHTHSFHRHTVNTSGLWIPQVNQTQPAVVTSTYKRGVGWNGHAVCRAAVVVGGWRCEQLKKKRKTKNNKRLQQATNKQINKTGKETTNQNHLKKKKKLLLTTLRMKTCASRPNCWVGSNLHLSAQAKKIILEVQQGMTLIMYDGKKETSKKKNGDEF